jgi:hypothetical protein
VREGDEADLDEPDVVLQGCISLLFRPGNASLPALETCHAADFRRDVWSVRWTGEHPCEAPWCDGPLGALESDGWVYSESAIERTVVREVDFASISRSSSIRLVTDAFSLVVGLGRLGKEDDGW